MRSPSTPPRLIYGLELRYALVVLLLDTGAPRTIAELVHDLADFGCGLSGRPGKKVSDAIRWEVAKGRVVRLGRGRYGPGVMPRSTEWYIRRRLGQLRADAVELRMTA